MQPSSPRRASVGPECEQRVQRGYARDSPSAVATGNTVAEVPGKGTAVKDGQREKRWREPKCCDFARLVIGPRKRGLWM
jgi:hypothetical protein